MRQVTCSSENSWLSPKWSGITSNSPVAVRAFHSINYLEIPFALKSSIWHRSWMSMDILMDICIWVCFQVDRYSWSVTVFIVVFYTYWLCDFQYRSLYSSVLYVSLDFTNSALQYSFGSASEAPFYLWGSLASGVTKLSGTRPFGRAQAKRSQVGSLDICLLISHVFTCLFIGVGVTCMPQCV